MVANQIGGELTSKLRRYAQMDITYYVVYDPFRELSDEPLRVYERGFGKRYRLRPDFQLSDLALQLTIWHGAYEAWEEDWLRWCDATGQMLPTGAESTQRQAERAARLAAKLRELGFDPEQV